MNYGINCGLIGYPPLEEVAIHRPCQNVDLEAVCSVVTIRGFVANLAVDITFKNKTDGALEVVYICPVDAKAAIYEFEATLDNRTIKAHCMEKKKAEQTYKKAIDEGKTAVLAEETHTTDLFEFSLGNMPAGEVARVHLQMVMELNVGTDGSVSFVMPTVFNPRYGTPEDSSPSPFEEKPIFLTSSKYTMDVSAKIFGSHRINRIESKSDPINISLEDDEMSASVTQDGGFTCDHDWSFLVYYHSPHTPQLVMETGDRTSTSLMKDDVIMANFFPEVPIESFSPHNELIFVIDRSGSMQGDKIDKARTTLLLFLKSLPHGCRFNIISFGNRHSALFPQGSVRYTEDTLKEALALQKALGADMGGTEIDGALRFVYSQEPTPGYPRQMIVITDGQVWNVDQVLEMVSRHARETRVFSVGIGDGASTALVKGLAMSGGGRYEMVTNNEQIQMKVMGLIANMLQESVLDARVECLVDPPQSVSLVPKVPPIVFGGQHLILYARAQPKSQVKSLKLFGKVGGKEFVCQAEEKHLKLVHDSNLSIHRLAAKAQLALWKLEGEEDKKESSTALSVASGVVCSYTAFVGVDQDGNCVPKKERANEIFEDFSYCADSMVKESANQIGGRSSYCIPNRPSNRPFSAFMPQASPKFSVFNRLSRLSNHSAAHSSPIAIESTLKSLQGGLVNTRHFSLRNKMGELFKRKQPRLEPAISQSADQLVTFVALQEFDGSWRADKLESASLMQPERMQGLISGLKEKGVDDSCIGTILALAILEKDFSDRKSEWQLVARKARSFLHSKGVPLDLWMEEAADLLSC